MSDQPEIPDFKRKEKERKKGGLLWRGAGGGGAPIEGAAGGGSGVARAAASAIASAEGATGEAAVQGGGFLARMLSALLSPFGRLASTFVGKAALAGLAALLVGGAALVAHYSGGASAPPGAGGGLNLGPIADMMHIRKGGSSGLDYAARANRGALAGAAPSAGAVPKAGEAPKPGETGKAQATAQAQTPPAMGHAQIQAAERHLAHDMSGTKLSTNFGGDFGSHNIFSGTQMGHGFTPANNLKAMLNPATSAGQASSRHVAAVRAVPMNLGRRGLGFSNAMNHLAFMAGMNRPMMSAGSQEQGAQIASDQFEAQQTQGGAPPSTPITGSGAAPITGGGASGGGGGGGVSIPGGSGGGSCTQPGQIFDGTSCVSPGNLTGADATPWEGMAQSAWQMANMAAALILMASIIFGILWSIGLHFLHIPCSTHIGIALMAAATMIAVAMTAMATMIGGSIAQMGAQVTAAGSQTIGHGLQDVGSFIQSHAWIAITAVGGAVISAMIMSKAAPSTGSLDQTSTQQDQVGGAGGPPSPRPTGGPQPSQGK